MIRTDENRPAAVDNVKSEELLNTIIAVIKEHLHPKRILLFGSRAKGRAREYSDFDIAIDGADLDIRKERLLREALDEKMGIYTVEVVDLGNVDEGFRSMVTKHGRILYER